MDIGFTAELPHLPLWSWTNHATSQSPLCKRGILRATFQVVRLKWGSMGMCLKQYPHSKGVLAAPWVLKLKGSVVFLFTFRIVRASGSNMHVFLEMASVCTICLSPAFPDGSSPSGLHPIFVYSEKPSLVLSQLSLSSPIPAHSLSTCSIYVTLLLSLPFWMTSICGQSSSIIS